MPPRRRRRSPLLLLLFPLACGRRFNATAQLARSKTELSKIQRLGAVRWLRHHNHKMSVLVQIGANNHQQSASYDPGPYAVRRGWRSVLIEPVPQIFAALCHTYNATAHVQAVNAAVCATAGSSSKAPHARVCEQGAHQRIWYVDMTNATGNWGKNHSDARCVLSSGAYGWVNEIASLRRETVLNHNRLLLQSRTSAMRCAKCAADLGRPLPPDCVRDVIRANLRSHETRCLCFAEELQLLSHERSVTLLTIDAEGADLEVLRQWPFDALPTTRVMFEAAHLSHAQFEEAAELLERHGFRFVAGDYGAIASEWQHVHRT